MPYLCLMVVISSIKGSAFYKKWLSWLVVSTVNFSHRGLPAAQTFVPVGVLAENLPDIGRI